MEVNDTQALTANILPANATNQTLSWTSDNNAVATVNSTTGVVSGVSEGIANITATALDGSGVSGTASVTVEALNLMPTAVAEITLFSTDGAPETYSFTGVNSSDPDGSIVEYQWDFGDGSPVFVSTDPIAIHEYLTEGNYTVSLVVVDNDGATSDPDTLDVTISASSPTFTFLWDPVTTPAGGFFPGVEIDLDFSILSSNPAAQFTMTVDIAGAAVNIAEVRYNGISYSDGQSFSVPVGNFSAVFIGNPAVTCDAITVTLIVSTPGLQSQPRTQSFTYNGGGNPCD